MAESLPTQIDYTSRDYQSLREDMIARVRERVPEWTTDDPADFGMALIESFAFMGDILNYYIDRVANESTISTATRRQTVLALARDMGYEPYGYTPSSVVLTFINTGEDDLTIPAGTRVAANIDSGDAVLNIPFETTFSVTVEAGGTETAFATQGRTVSGELGYGDPVGVSDGQPSQVFDLADTNVDIEGVVVYVYDNVNYFPWQRVDHFADYSPLSRVFRVLDDGSGRFQIQFGDGVSGLVPSQSHSVFAYYRVVDGTNGNVPAGTINEIESVPGLTDAQLAVLTGSITVTNDSPATGGIDPEDTESVRTLAPLAYRTANRAVTLEDFQNLSLAVGGCGKSSATAETPASVVVAVAPYRNFGTAEVRPGFELVDSEWEPTVEMDVLRSNVRERLELHRLAGTQVTVIDPVYVEVDIEVSVNAIDSVRQADAEVIIRQAILDKFDYSVVPFGASIYVSDIISTISDLGITREISVDTLKKTDEPSGADTVSAGIDEVISVLTSGITINVSGGVEDAL